MLYKNSVAVLLVGICLLISGCATVDPIQKKYQDLDALYASGQLSAYEYATAKEKILKEEIDQANAKAQADIKESYAKRKH